MVRCARPVRVEVAAVSGFFHFDGLEVDLYTLLSIVNAEAINDEMLSDPDVKRCLPVPVWRETMIERLLISCAVRLRMVEERFHAADQVVAYPYRPEEVCRFVVGSPSVSDGAKSGLRLAADKIVHAREVSYYADARFDVFRIAGMHNGKPWQVEVDTRKYLIAGLCLVLQYEENWNVSTRSTVSANSSEIAPHLPRWINSNADGSA